MNHSNLVIAIDGPAGSGKSTVAKRLASELQLTLLDTGAIYRSLALAAHQKGVDLKDSQALVTLASQISIQFDQTRETNRVKLDGTDVTEAIRTPEISKGASFISAIPEVRQALLQIQRQFAQRGSVVAEGRDIGTVVFPKASIKIFLLADPAVRAHRRHLELINAGHRISENQVLQEQEARDAADSSRSVAPLRPAADAVVLDSSQLSVDQVVEQIKMMIKRIKKEI